MDGWVGRHIFFLYWPTCQVVVVVVSSPVCEAGMRQRLPISLRVHRAVGIDRCHGEEGSKKARGEESGLEIS